MANRVIDRDRGYNRIRRNVVRMTNGKSVFIGVQGVEGAQLREGGISNAALAAIHEFGSKDGRIPQRPFLRGTADRERAKYLRLLEDAARKSADDGKLNQRLGVIGLVAVSDVRKTINQSIDLKPNARSTIRKKGSSKPLLDIGTLRDSVTSEVE